MNALARGSVEKVKEVQGLFSFLPELEVLYQDLVWGSSGYSSCQCCATQSWWMLFTLVIAIGGTFPYALRAVAIPWSLDQDKLVKSSQLCFLFLQMEFPPSAASLNKSLNRSSVHYKSNYIISIKRILHSLILVGDEMIFLGEIPRNIRCLFHPPHSLHLPLCLINSNSEVVLVKHLKGLFGSMLNVFLRSLHLNFSFNYIHYTKRRDCDCRIFALDAYILSQA